MPRQKEIESQNGAPERWSYRRVPAARELLDLIAVELAREYIELLENARTPKG
jgi:hypothetical protein